MSGSFAYLVKSNMGDKPVDFVAWLDAARYANWLHNGKPSAAQVPSTTETGAYDIVAQGTLVERSPSARWFLPTRIEWDLAAYDDPSAGPAWLYPTRSNEAPRLATTTPSGDVSNPGVNVANDDDGAVWNAATNVTTVGGGGPLSASYWGTHDQGENVAEWTETLVGSRRVAAAPGCEDSDGVPDCAP